MTGGTKVPIVAVSSLFIVGPVATGSTARPCFEAEELEEDNFT